MAKTMQRKRDAVTSSTHRARLERALSTREAQTYTTVHVDLPIDQGRDRLYGPHPEIAKATPGAMLAR